MNHFETIKEFQFIRNVLPGDIITEYGYKSLNIVNNKATVVGKLYKIENTLFIFSKTEKYTPQINDIVLGRIYNIQPDYYKINIGYKNLHIPMYTGILPLSSIINIHKINKYELNQNDLIICQIVEIKEDEILLNCNLPFCGKIPHAFSISIWKIQLLHFVSIHKLITTYYIPQFPYKIILTMNGFVYLEGIEYLELKKLIFNIFN